MFLCFGLFFIWTLLVWCFRVLDHFYGLFYFVIALHMMSRTVCYTCLMLQDFIWWTVFYVVYCTCPGFGWLHCYKTPTIMLLHCFKILLHCFYVQDCFKMVRMVLSKKNCPNCAGQPASQRICRAGQSMRPA